jgi:type I restriction enzyme R subunit
MAEIKKATLTEADIISKYLRPAIKAACWDENR